MDPEPERPPERLSWLADTAEIFEGLSRSHWWEAQLEGMPHPVLVRLAKGEDGRLVCTGLILGAQTNVWPRPDLGDEHLTPEREVTARSLRAVPLGAIVSRLTATSHLPGDNLANTLPPDLPLPKLRPGPKGHPRQHFEDMAARYRRALVTNPRRPVKAVSEETGYPEATVRRHLQRARDMGLLEPAPPGKAGEQRPKSTPREA